METIRYLALGDSIATGTITYWTKTKSYAQYLYDQMRKNKPQANIIFVNLATDGDTSQHLLYKLLHWKFLQKMVEKADIITLSIGGNDIMRAANIPGFCQINWHMADYSSTRFCTNWGKIILKMRELNPHCRIITNTLYNPYNETSFLHPWERMDTGLHEKAQTYIGRINDFLINNQGILYEVAPVHEEFLKFSQGKMAHMVCLYPQNGAYLFRNPHPNDQGHQKIAQICAEIIWQNDFIDRRAE